MTPRLDQVIQYSQHGYNPFDSYRLVATSEAMRNRHSAYNKKRHTLCDDRYNAINIMQILDMKNKYFGHLPPSFRGNFHMLQNSPKPQVSVWNEACLVSIFFLIFYCRGTNINNSVCSGIIGN